MFGLRRRNLSLLAGTIRRALTPEGPVYFWWQGTCYATRADGGVIRRRRWPIRLPDGRFVRLEDFYPIDLAIAGNVAAFDGKPAQYHEAEVAWSESPAAPMGPQAFALVVLSFNAPAQFEAWIERTAKVHPELLKWSPRILFDNSTHPDDAYDRLCERWCFGHARYNNVGIAGARMVAAQYVMQAGLGGMLFFEDDMMFHDTPGVCRNGFPQMVPGLIESATAIAMREGLDFLKLSFTEVMADHHVNIAWYAANQNERARDFPCANTPRITRTGSYGGCSYLIGDVFYGHWPTLLTRRGIEMLFVKHPPDELTELAFVRKSQELLARNLIRSGVLLASPIEHRRIAGYAMSERRE
jgi:hypothetical protein